MAIDDVVNAGNLYQGIINVATVMRRDPDSPNNPDIFFQYATQIGQQLPEYAKQQMRGDDRKLRRVVRQTEEIEKISLIDAVNRNYNEVINTLPEKKVVALALGIPDKNKNFEGPEAVEEIYAICDNPVWRAFVTMELGNPRTSEALIGAYIEEKQKKWLEQYSTEVTTKDGQKEKQIDYGKLRAYIKDTVANYTDNAIKNQVYLDTGKLYSDIKDERRREERGRRDHEH